MIRTLSIIMLLIYPITINGQIAILIISQGQQEVWICQECGAVNPSTNKYCTQCGHPGPNAKEDRSFILSEFDAAKQGEADAELDTNTMTWGALGCLLGLIGVGIAAVVEPNVPSHRLSNIPSQHVNTYISSYMSKAKRKQINSALGGCLLGTGVSLLIVLLAGSGD